MSRAAPSTSAAPPAVVTAYRLYLASVVLAVIGLVVSLVLLPQAIAFSTQEARRQLQGRDTGGVDVVAVGTGVAIGAAVVGAVLAIAFAVLTVVFARRMLRGRNWARIVLAVFAGLHLLGLLGLGGPGGAVAASVVALLEIVVVVTAAILTFVPSANPWFRRTTLPPAMP